MYNNLKTIVIDRRKGIITTDKQRFLDAERHYFTIMTDKEYKEGLNMDADSCEQCDVLGN